MFCLFGFYFYQPVAYAFLNSAPEYADIASFKPYWEAWQEVYEGSKDMQSWFVFNLLII